MPVGSSIVLRAVSGAPDGFAAKINFYTDWNGTSGTLISGATEPSYTLEPLDKGKTIKVRITGSKADYADLAKTEDPVAGRHRDGPATRSPD